MSWIVPLAAAAAVGHAAAGPWLPPAAALGAALACGWAGFLCAHRVAAPILVLAAAALVSAAAAGIGSCEVREIRYGRPSGIAAEVSWKWTDGTVVLMGAKAPSRMPPLPARIRSLEAPLRLRFDGAVDAAPGDVLILPGRVAAVAAAAGADGIDEADRLPARAVRLDPGEVAAAARPRRFGEPEWVVAARRHAERSLVARSGPGAAGPPLAMVLGQAWRLGGPDRAVLRAVGVSHLLAVSGFHLAILAWIVWRGLAGAASLSRSALIRFDTRRAAAAILLPLVWIFAALAGWRPSVVRATLMISAFLGARLLDRRATALDALALAAVVAFVALPEDVDDAGFQLSLAAVAGLLAGERWAARPAPLEDPPPLQRGATGAPAAPARWAAALGRLLSLGGRAVLRLLAASTFAALFTAPVTAARFGTVAPGAPLANLLAIPLFAAGAFPLAVAALLTASGPVPACVARAFVGASDAAWRFFVRVCEGLGRMLPAPIDVDPGDAPLAALICGALGMLIVRSAAARRAGAALLCAVAIQTGDTARGVHVGPEMAPPPGATTVTFLDVGDGDAILVTFADGRRMLVDGGGGRGPDAIRTGARALLPALERLGVHRIDWMIATHADSDHWAGIAAASRRYAVGELWTTPQAEVEVPASPFARWIGALERAGTRVRRTPEPCGVHRIGPAQVELLAPCGQQGYDARFDDNDNSIVARISVGCAGVLLVGDAGFSQEAALIGSGLDIEAEILKAGHHGSRFSSSGPFLAAVRPALVVISAGPRSAGKRGPPHREVLERIAGAGALTAHTAVAGAVTVHLTPAAIRAYDSSGRLIGAWPPRCSATSAPRRTPDGGYSTRAASPKVPTRSGGNSDEYDRDVLPTMLPTFTTSPARTVGSEM